MLPVGYFVEQGTRPQTIGYSLAESPAGLAAWLIFLDPHSAEQVALAFQGHPEGELTRNEILDNLSLYWVTNTGASVARFCWENAHLAHKSTVSLPEAFTVFPGEISRATRT
jgi:hypothetical protein